MIQADRATVGMAVALGGLVAVLPWSGAVLRMTGNIWQDQAEVPLFLFWFTSAFLLGLLIGRDDPPLGLLVAYIGALGLLWPTMEGVATIQYVMAAAILVLVVRRVAARAWGVRLLVGILVASAVIQVAYATMQLAGYDPAWWGLQWRADMQQAIGSIRNTKLLAVYLAVIAPLAPLWLAVVLVIGILGTHSLLGLLAVAVGLLVRYRRVLSLRWGVVATVLAGGLAALGHWGPGPSATLRLHVWSVGVWDLAGAPMFGYGPGGWAERVPPLFRALYGSVHRPPFATPTHAHNELLQFLYEGGAVGGLILLIGVLWHRRAWAHPVAGGALAAALVACLGQAPLHLASTALPIVVVYGLATSRAPAGPAPAASDARRERYQVN